MAERGPWQGHMVVTWLLVAGAWVLALRLGQHALPLPAVAHLATWSTHRPGVEVVGGILRLVVLVAGAYLLAAVSVAAIVGVVDPVGRHRCRSQRLRWPAAHLVAIGTAVASAVGAVSTLSPAGPAAATVTAKSPAPAASPSTAVPTLWRVHPTTSLAGRPVRRHWRATGHRPSGRPLAVTTAARGSIWVVAAGDSLWSIAVRHLGPAATTPQVAAYWERMIGANPQLVDPNLVFPGDRLHLPPRP